MTRIGEVATEYGWVVTGILRRVTISAEGREVVKGFVEPGRFAGDYRSLLTGAKSRQTVEALKRSHLLAS